MRRSNGQGTHDTFTGRIVTDGAELRDVVAEMRASGRVAFDTEFVGERNFFPRLGLLQLGTEKLVAAVDPVAIADLSPVEELLADRSVLKLVHAGWQDLKIFFDRTGVVPGPVFDTQVAAALLGLPAQAAYGAVVREFLGVDLAKGHSYSDWMARPLSPSQLAYALDDVRYLPAVHDKMTARLKREGRLDWLAPDLAALCDPETYTVRPEDAFRKVKGWAALDRKKLAVLRAVVAWRETEARRKDIPRRRVLSDDAAIAIARVAPADEESLKRIRGLDGTVGARSFPAIVAAVAEAVALPSSAWPELPPPRPRSSNDRPSVNGLLAALLRAKAKEARVASEILATTDDLDRLSAGERDEVPLLKGWRRELAGNAVLDLLEGRTALSIRDGEVVATPIPPR